MDWAPFLGQSSRGVVQLGTEAVTWIVSRNKDSPPNSMTAPPLKSAIALLSLLMTCGHLHALTISAYQSSARPLGLDIVSPVYEASSDAASASFQLNVLPDLQTIIDDNLVANVSIPNQVSVTLDPTQFMLSTSYDARVYFIGEGAGYRNTLGFNTQGVGVGSGNPQLIFPNASSNDSYSLNQNQGNGQRTTAAPLLPGDFVELGAINANTQLDFFLIANGANGGQYVYTANESYNPDGIQHVVGIAIENSPYLVVGFEDLYGGGDNDYNDILFAVDIGVNNINSLVNNGTIPEPCSTALLGLGGVVFLIRRMH